MADDEFKEQWREQHAGHDRLRWARMYWQLRAGAVRGTPTDAAKSLGWKPNTYLAYERTPNSSKHTPLDHQAAIEFSRRFQVSWRWLLLGEGTPFDDQLPEPQARVVEIMSKVSEDDQRIIVEMAEVFLKARRSG